MHLSHLVSTDKCVVIAMSIPVISKDSTRRRIDVCGQTIVFQNPSLSSFPVIMCRHWPTWQIILMAVVFAPETQMRDLNR